MVDKPWELRDDDREGVAPCRGAGAVGGSNVVLLFDKSLLRTEIGSVVFRLGKDFPPCCGVGVVAGGDIGLLFDKSLLTTEIDSVG
jgi:hypothetical protein